jgi:glycosyltransferase involved in cell wall biosynthesis
MISVIFPVYNEEGSLEELHSRLVKVLDGLSEPYEIIAVDDGSTDKSREILSRLSPIRAVLLSRNFGQNSAVDAGFQVSVGDYIITIDSDLQMSPEDIPLIFEKLKQGYGAVVGWRKDRHDSFSRRVFSRASNWLISKVTGVRLHDFSCSLKGYRREYVEGVQLLGETFIFMPVFAHDRGAKVLEVEVTHKERKQGVSKHSIGEMIFVLFDLISVKFLLNYFAKPLRFFGICSLVSLVLAFISFGTAIVLKIMDLKDLTVTPLPLIGTMFTMLAVILFMIGFVAEILLRIYYGQQERSQYMIYEVIKNK